MGIFSRVPTYSGRHCGTTARTLTIAAVKRIQGQISQLRSLESSIAASFRFDWTPPHCEYLVEDDEVGKTRATGHGKNRITLLLPGSSSLLQSDRKPGASPIEKFYKPYGKAEIVVAWCWLRPWGKAFGVGPHHQKNPHDLS